MMLLKLFILECLIAFTCSILIECKFGDEIINNWGVRYTCRTRKFDIKKENKIVYGVSGDHTNLNMTNENVTQFFAKGLKIEHVNMFKFTS